MWVVIAAKGGERTKLEWVVDADFRFFPTVRDETFGYVLHPVDLATNKLMAAAGRREPRDVVDLLTVHDRVLPLGAVVWAAVDKSPGFTPEGLINEVRRLGRYTAAEFRRVASDPPIDPTATMTRLRKVLEEADAFVRGCPPRKRACSFCKPAGWCSPTRTGLRPIKPMPDNGSGTGRAVRKSAPPCSNAAAGRHLNSFPAIVERLDQRWNELRVRNYQDTANTGNPVEMFIPAGNILRIDPLKALPSTTSKLGVIG